MDTITTANATDVLARTADGGGCTFKAGTLEVIQPTSGFAVGIGGAKVSAEDLTVASLAWLSYRVTGEWGTDHAGTWLQDGMVHIDAVLLFSDDELNEALEAGYAFGQQAIYDFTAKKEITL